MSSHLSGMTVNERLFTLGLLADFDAAGRRRDERVLLELLRRIELLRLTPKRAWPLSLNAQVSPESRFRLSRTKSVARAASNLGAYHLARLGRKNKGMQLTG